VVAEHLAELGVPFLRRVHPAPEPTKLESFADFARSLGYKMNRNVDRFALQAVLEQSAAKPEAYAVHYALLRSLEDLFGLDHLGFAAQAGLKPFGNDVYRASRPCRHEKRN